MAQDEPEPMPTPVLVSPAPEPTPQPASKQALAAAATWRSYRQRNCPECRPGEWSVTVEANLTGAGSCLEASIDAADSSLEELGEQAELAGFAGAVDGALALLPSDTSTGIANQLATARLGGCRLLGVTLPKGSRYVDFQYEHESAAERQECPADQPCPGGGATFVGQPRIALGAAATVIHTLAHGDDGIAVLTVFFRAPNDRWAPSSQR